MSQTPPAPKRMLLSQPNLFNGDVSKVAHDVQAICFPWAEAVPPHIYQWFEAYGKAYNTAPEYVFLGAIATTAAIMGPKSFIKVRDTYKEPTNIYIISVGYPGSGKSQAYRMTVSEPIETLEPPFCSMLVDDYTKRGLHKHLQEHDRRALVAHEELGALFDLINKRQFEGAGERQLYCRLYDGGKWISSTGW